MSNTPTAEPDPWLDEHVHLQSVRPDDLINTVTDIANEENPEIVPELADQLPTVEPGQPDTPPAPPASLAEPEVITLDDGSSITMEQTKRGLKATLESATGAKPEVFYGKDREELLRSVLVGKLNATKKIHQLSAREKLVSPNPVAEAPAEGVENVLTADQKFEIKTALEAGDMEKAMELTFKYKYGRGLKDVVIGSERGQAAKAEMDTGAVAQEFANNNPDYYADAQNHNFFQILSWLSNRTNGPAVTVEILASSRAKFEEAWNYIVTNGYWTVNNLQRAYNDLTEQDVLVSAPAAESEIEDEPLEQVKPKVSAPKPKAPAQPSERIVRETRRPRAGLGIRPSSVSTVIPDESTTAPSVDELDNLTDADLSKLYSETLRLARRGLAQR